MKVKYFHDTATALIEFSTHAVVETKEINENIYIDLDATEIWLRLPLNTPTYMRIYLICSMSK